MKIKHDALFPVVFGYLKAFNIFIYLDLLYVLSSIQILYATILSEVFSVLQGKSLKDSNSVFMVEVLVFLLLRLLRLSISFSLKSMLL